MSDQLKELAKPFPARLVKDPPRGKYGDYVPHATITERLLEVLGPFSFEVVELIRGFAPEVKKRDGTVVANARDGAIVGVMARLTAEVDGRTVTVQEIGTDDNPAMHHDAECAKNAASDALKRCAMRLGCGLHLWSQEDYYLHKSLERRANGAS